MDTTLFEIQNFSCSLFAKNLKGIYVWVNEAMLTKHGLKSHEILGKVDEELPWARFKKFLCQHDKEVIESLQPIVFRETISREGCIIKGLCHKSPIFSQEGKIIGVRGVFMDIPTKPSLLAGLTVREKQCLAHVVSGKTSQESAEALGLSRRTVESYLEVLKSKLNCKNKAELIIKYYTDS